MLALLGSLLGFASGLLPDVFPMFRDKKDKARELAILHMQMELTEKRRSNCLAEICAEADATESLYIYKFLEKSGNPTIDALSPRPCVPF